MAIDGNLLQLFISVCTRLCFMDPVLKTFYFQNRLSEFTTALEEWLSAARGLVVAVCISQALSPDIYAVNGFLSQYGLQYSGPGWDGSKDLNPQSELINIAHSGR